MAGSPSIRTVKPYNITSTGFTSGGYSIYDIVPTTKGLLYSTISNDSSATYKSINTGTSNPYEQIILSELTNNTVYYVRAYCSNGTTNVIGDEYQIRTLAQDALPNTCVERSITLNPNVTYDIPKGVEIIYSDTPTNVLESNCLDVNLIPYTPSVTNLPGAPRNLRWFYLGNGQLNIDWEPPTSIGNSPIIKYKIYIYRGESLVINYPKTINVGGSFSTSHRASPVTNSTLGDVNTYYYARISAINSAGEGPVALSPGGGVVI
jgi:hypothetical protein